MIYTRRYLLPHPIVFVMDSSNESVEIPEYDPETIISSNNTCISVRTISDVDGEVTLGLAEKNLPTDAQASTMRVFASSLRTPSRRIALVTSENQTLIECSVGADEVTLQIFVDDESQPATIWVVTE